MKRFNPFPPRGHIEKIERGLNRIFVTFSLKGKFAQKFSPYLIVLNKIPPSYESNKIDRIKKYWFLTKLEVPENGILKDFKNAILVCGGEHCPLMTSSGAKKLILAYFYDFSGSFLEILHVDTLSVKNNRP